MVKIKDFLGHEGDRESTELGHFSPRTPPASHSASTGMGSVDCKLVKGDASLGETALLLEAAVVFSCF